MQQDGFLKQVEGLTFSPTINQRKEIKNIKNLSFASTIVNFNSQRDLKTFENARLALSKTRNKISNEREDFSKLL